MSGNPKRVVGRIGPEPSEYCPLVTDDQNLLSVINHVEYGIQYFYELLSEQGMKDDDIAATNIILSGDTYIGASWRGLEIDYGKYYPQTNTIKLNVGTIRYVWNREINNYPDEPNIERYLNANASLEASSYLIRLLGYRVEYAKHGTRELTEENFAYYRTFTEGMFMRKLLHGLFRANEHSEGSRLIDSILLALSGKGRHIEEPYLARIRNLQETETQKYTNWAEGTVDSPLKFQFIWGNLPKVKNTRID